jgi:hypothetical protein
MKEWGAGRDSADWRRILRRAEIDRDRGLELIIRRSLVRVQAGPSEQTQPSRFGSGKPVSRASRAGVFAAVRPRCALGFWPGREVRNSPSTNHHPNRQAGRVDKPWEGYELVPQPWRTIAILTHVGEAVLIGIALAALIDLVGYSAARLIAVALTLELVRRLFVRAATGHLRREGD